MSSSPASSTRFAEANSNGVCVGREFFSWELENYYKIEILRQLIPWRRVRMLPWYRWRQENSPLPQIHLRKVSHIILPKFGRERSNQRHKIHFLLTESSRCSFGLSPTFPVENSQHNLRILWPNRSLRDEAYYKDIQRCRCSTNLAAHHNQTEQNCHL